MALFTIISQVVLVWVLVAIVAVGKRQARKDLKFFSVSGFGFVALRAFYLCVFAYQLEFAFVVIKF